MYDYTTSWKESFCHCCLQAFSTVEKLKSHVNDCFNINGTQMIKMPKKVNMLYLKVIKKNKITIYELCRF